MRAPFIPKLSPGDRNPSDEQHAKRGGNAVEKRGTFFSNHTKKFQTWLVEKLGMCGVCSPMMKSATAREKRK